MRGLFLTLAAVIASTLALSGVADANPSQLGSPLSTSELVTQYQSPAGARSIATGSDGKVWFTETNGIGRIAPGGEVESFELAEGSGRPRALTAGPDGNVGS